MSSLWTDVLCILWFSATRWSQRCCCFSIMLFETNRRFHAHCRDFVFVLLYLFTYNLTYNNNFSKILSWERLWEAWNLRLLIMNMSPVRQLSILKVVSLRPKRNNSPKAHSSVSSSHWPSLIQLWHLLLLIINSVGIQTMPTASTHFHWTETFLNIFKVINSDKAWYMIYSFYTENPYSGPCRLEPDLAHFGDIIPSKPQGWLFHSCAPARFYIPF